MNPSPDPAAGSDVTVVADVTVKIPVKIVKGRVTYVYGKKRPPIRDGAIGDLVLSARDVLDLKWVRPLIEEKTVQLLPAGARLLLAVRLKKIPAEKYGLLFEFDPERAANLFLEPAPSANDASTRPPTTLEGDAKYWKDWAFAAAELLDPLDLTLRGTKQAVLQQARCRIESLARIADSVNHAYTLVSEALEPDRRSHTGNVFERARYFDGRHWRLLRDLRREHEAAYEEILMAGNNKKDRKLKPGEDQQGILDFW